MSSNLKKMYDYAEFSPPNEKPGGAICKNVNRPLALANSKNIPFKDEVSVHDTWTYKNFM